MYKMSLSLHSLFFFLGRTTFALVLTGHLLSCGSKAEPQQLSSSSSGGTTGVVQDSAGFFVKPPTTSDIIENTTHKFNDYDSECSIDTDETSITNLKCLMNVRELDFWYWGIQFEVNVPSSMCEYILEYPYFYYNRQPGTGPRSVDISYNSVGIQTCSFTSQLGVTRAGIISADLSYCTAQDGDAWSDGQTVNCNYNHQNVDDTYPNCCEGTVTLSSTDEDPTPDTTTTTTMEFGGKHDNCLVIADANWPKTSTGRPVARITYIADVGYNITTEWIKPRDYTGTALTNLILTNMYGWSDYQAGTHSAASYPEAVVPGTDGGGNPISPGSPSFLYQCLDEAMEVKQQIRMYINDWNTNTEYASYVSSSGASGNPNLDGNEGGGGATDCQPGGITVEPCNDFYDWDDLGSSYPNDISP